MGMVRNGWEEKMIKILIVDDEKPICDLIDLNLSASGYHCTTAQNGMDALDLIDKENYDLILLDIMLPGADGYDVMAYVRPLKIPVIFITAKHEVRDRVKGLKAGADDYLVKPFDVVELVARVEAVLRRTKKAETEFTLGDMKCDFDRHQVFLKGAVIECTPKEYELLEVLIRNRNIALSRDKLLDMVWGYDFDGGTRTVDVHIQRLRHKLHLENYIKTVYKLGYRLEA